MVGLVIVSHSAALAEGVVALAREMGDEVAIEAAGGMEDGAIGTDAERVRAAIERARSDDGVLVLMDLGSALMSAEIAVEMADPDGGPIRLSDAPLVEGAVAAAASARGGATLDEVAREARGAIRMKTEQLGGDDDDPAEPPADLGSGRSCGCASRTGSGSTRGRRRGSWPRCAGSTPRSRSPTRRRAAGRPTGAASPGSPCSASTWATRSACSRSGPEAAAALDAVRALAAANWGDAATPDRPDERVPQRGGGAPDAGARLVGVAASPGIAIGAARRLRVPEPVVEDGPVGSVEEERERLDAARTAVRGDLEAARAAIAGRGGATEADIFDAHALLLDDDALLAPATAAIGDGAGAARAWQSAAADAAASFRALEDPYLQERAVDVEDVARRVLGHLAGTPFAAVLDEPGIVLADELTPGEAAALDSDRAYAIATARGGATGHAAILARALGIPAVVGLGESLLAIEDGTPLVLDGEQGTVEIDPDPATIADREERRRADDAARAEALQRAAEPGALRDGRRVEVVANIGSAAEARPAVEQGAEGVGLLRTEFLFLDRADPPSEDEQVAVLTEIAEALDGRPLIVRTLDAGADKPLPFLRQAPEDNPFLGRRGIRLSLAEPELFRTQLRAVLRVAAEHPLKLMFPMVATVEELRAARAHLDAERAALGSAAELEVGVMVEVPALALAAAQVAPEVDFFSIGTNDLAQYTMAAERGNATLAALLDDASRAPVLRLIAAVVEAAEAHGRWVGVCGELAGDPEAAVALVGVGVRELSMAAGRIPAVKAALRETDGEAAAAAAQRVLGP